MTYEQKLADAVEHTADAAGAVGKRGAKAAAKLTEAVVPPVPK